MVIFSFFDVFVAVFIVVAVVVVVVVAVFVAVVVPSARGRSKIYITKRHVSPLQPPTGVGNYFM